MSSQTTSTDNTQLRIRMHKAKESPSHFMEMFIMQMEKSVWAHGLTALGAGMVGLHSSSVTAEVSNPPP